MIGRFIFGNFKVKEFGCKKNQKKSYSYYCEIVRSNNKASEAVAKISLSEEINESHIDEAHKLFANSTMSAITSGKELGVDMP